MGRRRLLTSEAVCMGHPDKIADQISDAILDAILAQDPLARVACETLVTTGLALVAGEITTSCYVDIPVIVRETIREVGYTDASMGFDYETCAVLTSIQQQSEDISIGVTEGVGLYKEQGASDQGIVSGYACSETPELMPLPIMLARGLTEELGRLRRTGEIHYLRPDGKSQVTVEYDGDEPARVDTVIISSQHTPEVTHDQIHEDLIEKVIKRVIPSDLLDTETIYHVNPTGRFVVGGPHGDAGLTGRKSGVDAYGGFGCRGGGAFSGKDPSKVDRTASYMARHIAKNIVAAGLAERCTVQLAYAIGLADPVSVMVTAEGTGRVEDPLLEKLVRTHFPLKPKAMIDALNLRRPIYTETARYGHFGRNHPDYTWERTDRAQLLREAAGL